MEALLRLEKIDKSFFGIQVLKSVSLEVVAGHTLGLVGENGAGKSTLMNILGGNLRADAGCMYINEQPYRPSSPRDSDEAGIAFIHQELNLFPNLSIAENLFLTRFPGKTGWIDRRTLNARSTQLLEPVGLDLPPTLRVESLSSGERQLVEIAKALSLDAKLIIFDEPTTSLSLRASTELAAPEQKKRALPVLPPKFPNDTNATLLGTEGPPVNPSSKTAISVPAPIVTPGDEPVVN